MIWNVILLILGYAIGLYFAFALFFIQRKFWRNAISSTARRALSIIGIVFAAPMLLWGLYQNAVSITQYMAMSYVDTFFWVRIVFSALWGLALTVIILVSFVLLLRADKNPKSIRAVVALDLVRAILLAVIALQSAATVASYLQLPSWGSADRQIIIYIFATSIVSIAVGLARAALAIVNFVDGRRRIKEIDANLALEQ